jgi:hypothetical protein
MKLGEQFTIVGMVYADRQWWQFWKKRNPLAGQPVVWTVKAVVSSDGVVT